MKTISKPDAEFWKFISSKLPSSKCNCHIWGVSMADNVLRKAPYRCLFLLDLSMTGLFHANLNRSGNLIALPTMGPTENHTSKQNSFTDHQKRTQQILAVTFALVSILSAIITIYWFYRLKRIFRHELVMLLIGSNMFKALWYFIPAMVNLVQNHPIPGRLCRASGFMLAVGIESAGKYSDARQLDCIFTNYLDFIILLIAVHTAMSVFRPGKSSGLRSYRSTAYGCWAVFSILLPALAFVNPVKDQAYISQGTFCYFPARPIWYRLALSWIPRYIILVTVVAIYISIYVYSTMQFGKFHASLTHSPLSTTTVGLGDTCDRRSAPLGVPSLEKTQPASTDCCDFTAEPSRPNEPRQSDLSPGQVIRRPTLLEALRDNNLMNARRNSKPREANHALRKRHRTIQKQLRYMFIYPLVYLLMWIAPFVTHSYFYTRSFGPPFNVNSIGLVCLCLQCAVDCLIFNIRERPWRYARHGHTNARRRSSTSTNSDIASQDISAVQPGTGNNSGAQREPRSQSERYWWDSEPI